MGVFLRPAGRADARLLFDWANDPVTRANSFSPEAVEWESHVEWLDARLSDSGRSTWVAVNGGGEPLGMVRLDPCEGGVEISINVAPELRGGGFGSKIIDAASREALERGALLVVAYIKHDNVASQRAFGKAGFVEAGEADVRGAHPLRFERRN